MCVFGGGCVGEVCDGGYVWGEVCVWRVWGRVWVWVCAGVDVDL